jgi:hypothetical protein
MSVVYRVCCDKCHYAVPPSPASASAVIADELSSSAFAHPEGKSLVVLPQSLHSQRMIFKQLGLSHRAAALAGRLVFIRHVICGQCGASYELRRLAAGLTTPECVGFLVLALLATAGGVTVRLITGAWWAGLLAGLGSLFLLIEVTARALSAYVRWRYRNRTLAFTTSGPCPRCGGREYVDLAASLKHVFPCPQCGERSLRVTCETEDYARNWHAIQPLQWPVFVFLPEVHLGPDNLLEFRAGWFVRRLAYVMSGVLLFGFLLFVAEGWFVGDWEVAWKHGSWSLLGFLASLYFSWKATRVQFHRKSGNLTIWRSRGSEPTSQRLLANLSAVRLLTFTSP